QVRDPPSWAPRRVTRDAQVTRWEEDFHSLRVELRFELPQLLRAELAPAPRAQRSELDVHDSHAHEPPHAHAQHLAHAPDLPVAPLREDEAEHARGESLRHRGQRLAAVEPDPSAHAPERAVRDGAVDLDHILLLVTVTRAQDRVHELAAVREQDQA